MQAKHRENDIYPLVENKGLGITINGEIFRITKHGAKRAEHLSGKYYQVRAMVNGERIHALAHRLIWRHFRGVIPGNLTINHKNGNKLDNVLHNLELASHSEQVRHARAVLGKMSQRGEKNNHATLVPAEIVMIREARARGMGVRDISQLFKITEQTVSKIVLRQRWQHLTG